MTGKQLMAKCEQAGWYLARIKGSHHIMHHPDYPYHISIPIHGARDLKKGTIEKILKQAGLK